MTCRRVVRTILKPGVSDLRLEFSWQASESRSNLTVTLVQTRKLGSVSFLSERCWYRNVPSLLPGLRSHAKLHPAIPGICSSWQ